MNLFDKVCEKSAQGDAWRRQLKFAESFWQSMRTNKNLGYDRDFVTRINRAEVDKADFDMTVLGGTLGLIAACYFAKQNFNVAVVDRFKEIKGREQEWNITYDDLLVLEKLGILSKEQIDSSIVSRFKPVRVSIHGRGSYEVENCLNLGLSPRIIIEHLKTNFLSFGGIIFTDNIFESCEIYDNMALVKTDKMTLKTRLVIDAMGHFSPIVKQIRKDQTPDSVCMVVGGSAKYPTKDKSADVLATISNCEDNGLQNYWQSFPSFDGRTNYMFSYMDLNDKNPKLTEYVEKYFEDLESYQSVSIDNFEMNRLLIGVFPCYKSAALKPAFDRVVQLGDASASQSPLSFGGFGALLHRIEPICLEMHHLLDKDTLCKKSLKNIYPYCPSLSVSWLFHKAMMFKGQDAQFYPKDQINRMLDCNFLVSTKLHKSNTELFMREKLRFHRLAIIMGIMPLRDFSALIFSLRQIGLRTLISWPYHFISLGIHQLLWRVELNPKSTKRRARSARYRLNSGY